LWLRWQAVRPRLLPVTVAVAAMVVVWTWTSRRGDERGSALAPAPAQTTIADRQHDQPGMPSPGMPSPGMPSPGMPSPGMIDSFDDARSRDIAEADQRYQDTIA